MKGLIVTDWFSRQAEFEQEVGAYYQAGKICNKETVVKGIDHAVDAFLGLFHGANTGKMLVAL
jgi:NADPH-dependent curcumin reductase CurA